MLRTLMCLPVMLSLLCSHGFGATMPGQDISAYARVNYCSQVQSIVPTALLETPAPPVSAGPATSFVAPSANAPIYSVSTGSFYAGASLVGKCVKLAGMIHYVDGFLWIDDGRTVGAPDPLWPNPSITTYVPVRVPLRADLLTSWPADGSFVVVQGVVRLESDGLPSLLPLGDSAVTRVHP